MNRRRKLQKSRIVHKRRRVHERNRKKINFNIKNKFILLFLIIPLVFTVSNVNIIKKFSSLEVYYYKKIFNEAFPIAELVFNNGNVKFSVSEQMGILLKNFFKLDINNPRKTLEANLGIGYMISNNEYKHNENNIMKSEKNQYKTNISSAYYEESDNKNMELAKNQEVNYNDVKIFNETSYKINIKELLNEPLKLRFEEKGPKVLIIHTHTTEGYLKDISQLDDNSYPIRTVNSSLNVVRVGEEITSILNKNYDIGTLHNSKNHIENTDVGAYSRALQTQESILKSFKSIGIVLDIHRDGVGQNKKFRPVIDINGEKYAKMMFVIGTDDYGLKHGKWRENLKFAIRLQLIMNEISPGIMRHIYISKYRYNQHTTNGSIIVEIGGDGNTIQEALNTSNIFARGISRFIYTIKSE